MAKVRFFKEKENNKDVYYAFVSDPYHKGYFHVTDGRTLSQAVYMAHDLLALLQFEPDKEEEKQQEVPFTEIMKQAEEYEMHGYLGTLDMDVKIRGCWTPNRKNKEPLFINHSGYHVHEGSVFPNKKMPFRARMLERAYHFLDFNHELFREAV